MRKSIYISGQISGLSLEEIKKNFEKAENELKLKGYKIINPLKLKHKKNATWSDYMKVDIIALCKCDEIYMLDNWIESRGAIIEHNIALVLGIKINYQKV